MGILAGASRTTDNSRIATCQNTNTMLSTYTDGDMYFLTLMLQLGGGILPPRRTFYPVALKPLTIVTKAFVTFPEYVWAKTC